MDLRKAKYILPNMFTLASLYCGVFSIHLSTSAESASQMAVAAWLLVVAMACDAFDGRVARLTKSESEFGIQMDSLADAISFGVAPAFLLYSWGLSELGGLGLFFAFIFASCSVMRLARFNVMANAEPGVMKYFLGLPTPLAAGTIVSVVLAHVSLTDQFTTNASGSVAAMAVLLGGLMVSNVRYRTFKDVSFHGRTFAVLLSIVAAAFAVSVIFKPSVAFVVLMVAYIVLGLGGGILSISKHVLRHGEDPNFLDDKVDPLLADADDVNNDNEQLY